MNLKDIRLFPKEPLTAGDQRLLKARYRQRLRSFLSVAVVMIVLVLIEAGPNTAKINAAIENPKLRWAILSVSLTLGVLVFYRRVWIYQRDLRAGFKYVNRMLVIGRSANGSTIDLEDLEYHNLEVGAEAVARLQPGDRYPVGFAACSGLPLDR